MANVEWTQYASQSEWLEARRNTIGASEAAAVLGASKYDTPLSLYLSKLGLVPEDEGKADLFRIGLLMEPVVAQLYQLECPDAIVLTPRPYTVYRNSAFPEWMTATPDRLLAGLPQPAPLELKNLDWRMGVEWVDEPPLTYIIQLQHQMACLDADEGILAALVGGNRFKWCALKRDNDFIDGVLVPALVRFRTCLEMQVPPDPDDSERTREALKAAYPTHVPNKVVVLGGGAIEWDEAREAASADLADAEARKREAENRLLLALGDAERGELPNGVAYTCKLQSRKESVIKATSFRVLRRSSPKGA